MKHHQQLKSRTKGNISNSSGTQAPLIQQVGGSTAEISVPYVSGKRFPNLAKADNNFQDLSGAKNKLSCYRSKADAVPENQVAINAPGKKCEVTGESDESRRGTRCESQNHDANSPRSFLLWDEIFSRRSIIKQLCLMRVKEAEKRAQQLFFGRLRDGCTMSKSSLPDVFPPRRLWAPCRPCHRRGKSRRTILAESIQTAIDLYQGSEDQCVWLPKLNALIEFIQSRAQGIAKPHFDPPKIALIQKSPDKPEQRVICEFRAIDSIVISLASRYFQGLLEPLFLTSSIGFRSNSSKTRNVVIEQIRLLRIESQSVPLYVAECDIAGFFDCISHEVVVDRFKAIETLLPEKSFDPRAKAMLDAYLACYSFPTSVLALPGTTDVKWHEQMLKKHYAYPRDQLIGIPQGGALSNIIANVVMHGVDVDIQSHAVKHGENLAYYRYCDDMILIGKERKVVEEAYCIYAARLKSLKLPMYLPRETRPYEGAENKRHHWDAKSRAPYLWGHNTSSGGYPWIGFLGYQIRWDGLMRIRPSTAKKHIRKMTDLADRTLMQVGPIRGVGDDVSMFPAGVSKSRLQILYRLRCKMEAMLVGKSRDFRGLISSVSWAGAFQALSDAKIVNSQLKVFDRHMERQLHRVKRRLAGMSPPLICKDKSSIRTKHRKPGVVNHHTAITHQKLN